MIRIIAFSGIMSFLFFSPLFADGTHPPGIRLDGSVGNAGNIALSGPHYTIKPEYGRQAGANLFHSFQQFNLHQGESATFSGPDSVKNIISRISGGSQSWIDGRLASTIAGADLYFLNPFGIMFGSNASLDLKGSFHVSTADYLRMGDNKRFYAMPMANEILSVPAPAAFGFLSDTPAKISIEGKGYIPPESYEDEIFKGLRVFGNNSFSIIGGDIEFKNGKYTTIDDDNLPLGALAIPQKGRINLASAASSGEVVLKPDGIDITSEKLGNIRISEESALHVGGGQVYIRSGSFVADKGYINAGEIDLPNGKIIGGNDGLVDINVNTLSFSNDSDILIQTLGSGDAGNVNIQARKAAFAEYSSVTSATYASGNAGNISISAEELSFDTNSGITSATAGSGNAGSVKIIADRLSFTDKSGINSSSFAEGKGGDVLIRAEKSVTLANSGIYSVTFGQESTAGAAGKVHIITPELRLSDTSKIWTSTAGQGNAGWINFEVSELDMSGRSSVASDSLSEGAGGKGGGILIGQSIEQTGNTHTISQPVQHIRMQDQSYIGTSARGEGNAGGVAIAVSRLEMDNGSVISSSSRQGEGGGIVLGKHIEVNVVDKSYLQEMDDTVIQVDQPADMIRIQNQSGISVSAEGEKNAGGIAVAAKELEMDNGSFITSSGKSSGSGGLILIGGSVSELENNSIQLLSQSDAIRIHNNSVVSTSASGQGDAGAIFMRSSNVSLDSGAAVASASLSETDGGDAGIIEIHAEEISLENNAKITTSGNGQGKAGTIILDTSRLDMDTEASISSVSRSETDGGDGGEIFIVGNVVSDDSESSVTLQASDSIRLRNNASVSTSSNGQGKAGNIVFSTSSLEMDSSASISSGSLSYGDGGDGGGIAAGKEIVIQQSGTETALVSITKPADTIRIRDHANINTSSNGRGNAGRIGLGVSEFELDTGASISSVSRSEGESGDGGVIIVAGAIEEIGKNLYAASELSSNIHLRNNAGISTSSAGTGNAGSIFLFASETAMDSSSSVSSASLYEQNGGHGGIIQILGDYLKFENHAGITTSSSGQGDAGAIFLLASQMEMDTHASISSLSQSRTDGGKGGGIFMMKNRITDDSGSTLTFQPSDSIRLQNNASVSTSSSGQGEAGNILLITSELEMDSSASISSGSLSDGNGGNGGAIGIGKEIVMKNIDTEYERFSVTQPADMIRLKNRANINTSSHGYGDAGEIGLGVSELELDTGAFISSIGKNGQGGMIIISGTIDEPENEKFTTPGFADSIRLHGNSSITTSSEGSGDAGDIRLKVRHLEMRDVSVSSDAASSGGGRITVNAQDTVHLTDSSITTNVFSGIEKGGDITVGNPDSGTVPRFVVLNRSGIRANAYGYGDGGAVFIHTDHFLKSFGSIVEASSARGNEGTVRIEAPEEDVTAGLISIPTDFIDAGKWLPVPCSQRSGEKRSRFTIDCRDSVPLAPDGCLGGPVFELGSEK